MPKAVQSTPSKSSGKKSCAICGSHFRPQVFASHVRKCEREKEEKEGRQKYAKEMMDQAQAALAGNVVQTPLPPSRFDLVLPRSKLT